MTDEGWLMTDEGMIDYKLFDGFALRQTDEQTDICDCRVAFATENVYHNVQSQYFIVKNTGRRYKCATSVYLLVRSCQVVHQQLLTDYWQT